MCWYFALLKRFGSQWSCQDGRVAPLWPTLPKIHADLFLPPDSNCVYLLFHTCNASDPFRATFCPTGRCCLDVHRALLEKLLDLPVSWLCSRYRDTVLTGWQNRSCVSATEAYAWFFRHLNVLITCETFNVFDDVEMEWFGLSFIVAVPVHVSTIWLRGAKQLKEPAYGKPGERRNCGTMSS